MNNKEAFAKRLKQLREQELKKTQREFASFVESTPATISAYENETKNPSLEIVMNIAKKCNVSLDWLCGLSDKKNPDGIPQTYSEVIQMLFDLEEAGIYYFTINGVCEWSDPDNRIKNYTGSILFYDITFAKFFYDWKDMKNLHDKKTIDDNLYGLWMKQQIEKYNFNFLSPDDQYMEVQIMEEERRASQYE